MTRGEFGIGLVVTAMVFFITAGAAVRLGLDGAAALSAGALVWAGTAAAFIRTIKSKPAPQRP